MEEFKAPPINTSLKNTKRLWLGIRSARCDYTQAKLWFFWGHEFVNHQIYELDQANDIMKHEQFVPSQKTALYVHGYVESPAVESIHVIVDAYQRRGDQNIIILNWGELAEGNYILDAVVNAKQLGPKMAEVLIGMFNAGLPIERFHLVGHSLGGQLSGIIGRNIISKSKNQYILPRISALDPAFPPFYPGTGHISAADAKMVDVIHTDAWLYGAPVSTGSIDFWPNSGKTLQPGCPARNYKMLTDNDLCSHRRSWRFWADSVANKDEMSFPSVRSKSWNDFKKGRIEEGLIVYMGIDCVDNVKGDFYLQTHAELPFSRGMDGIRYADPKTITRTPDSSKEPTSKTDDTDVGEEAAEAVK